MDYKEFCEMFTDSPPAAVLQGERYYIESEELALFKSGEQRKPHSKGLFLGQGRKFVPSLALLRILATTSKRKAFIESNKTEWLFICGRDVLPGNFRSELTEGLVLVQNNSDENLGLGRIAQGRDGLIIKNILDRGNYLRHDTIKIE